MIDHESKIMVDTCLWSSYFTVIRAQKEKTKVKQKELDNYHYFIKIFNDLKENIVIGDLIIWEVIRNLSPKNAYWENIITEQLKGLDLRNLGGIENIQGARDMVKKMQVKGHNFKGNIDGLIAYTCLKENMVLASDDSGFNHVSGLRFWQVPQA